MNKLTMLLACLLLSAAKPQTAPVDTLHSIIHWKGTKLNGRGFHEGILKLRSGTLTMLNGKLCGGTIIVDMNSVKVTDIPPHDPIPLFDLTKHLKEEFATSKYPTAKIVISRVERNRIVGNLTIMDRIAQIHFPFRKNNWGYEATLIISRRFWKIGRNAGWLENELVDDQIRLRVCLKTSLLH